jgi:alkyldihydroxyacetonephosphate synthase
MTAPRVGLELAAALAEIVGPDNVISGETAVRYAWDALAAGRGYRDFDSLDPHPLAAVRPASTEEVAAIVRFAAGERVPLVPLGGGSGLMGGAVPAKPAVVVDLTRMDRVLAVDPQAMSARVQAGAVLRSVDEALQPHSLMLGHDPWTVGVATIGGAIATNSIGYRGARYGSMGEQVLGLTAVLPDGSVVTTRPARKSSVGMDLNGLFIGSEGCFGIVTEAIIRVFPTPESRALGAYEFPSFEDGFEAVTEVDRLGLAPSLMDFGEDYTDNGEPTVARLHIGFEGYRQGVRAAAKRARRVSRSHGARTLPNKLARRFWARRHDIGDRYAESRRSGSPRAVAPPGFDFVHVSLPASRVVEYRSACLRVLEEHRLQPYEIGLWCTPELFSVSMGGPREALSAAVDDLVMAAQDMGGSMEYTHGVGLRLAHLMEREHGPGLDTLRAIKRALDPLDIMNPGKLAL